MTTKTDQANRVYDDSPQRFLDGDGAGAFAGASKILFEQAMSQTRMAVCLSDPNAEDSPIVFANRAFLDLTGYDRDDVIGRNCRFLQGSGTNPREVAKIRTALEEENVIVVEMLNYKKDGTEFWNALHIGPIYDDDGDLAYYFGSQWDVSDVHAARADEAHAKTMARELSHRMKNMFAVIGAIVNITGRVNGMSDIARTINDRIQALGRAYEPTLDDAIHGSAEVGQAIRAVLDPYDPSDKRFYFLGDEGRVDPNIVSIVGLTLHELAVNAIKHGALANDEGFIEVDWRIGPSDEPDRDTLTIDWLETGGPSVEEPERTAGSGLGIMQNILKAANGRISYDWRPGGLKVEVAIPVGTGRDEK